MGLQGFISRCSPICVQFTRYGNFCCHRMVVFCRWEVPPGLPLMSLCPWAMLGPVTVQWELSGSRKGARTPYSGVFVAGHFASLGLSPSPGLVSALSCGVGPPHTAVSELPFGVLWLSDHCFYFSVSLESCPGFFVPHLLLASPSPLHYFI